MSENHELTAPLDSLSTPVCGDISHAVPGAPPSVADALDDGCPRRPTKAHRAVRWNDMAAVSIEMTEAGVSVERFTAFYRVNLPTIYGYLLRLCGGDRALAEDLTQDAWFELVRDLSKERADRLDVRWLLTVARSRFIDHARREQRGRSKLALLQPLIADVVDDDPSRDRVLAVLADVQPLHRAVLMMRYVEDLPVSAIAGEIGRNVTATHSLLARARAELRTRAESVAHG